MISVEVCKNGIVNVEHNDSSIRIHGSNVRSPSNDVVAILCIHKEYHQQTRPTVIFMFLFIHRFFSYKLNYYEVVELIRIK